MSRRRSPAALEALAALGRPDLAEACACPACQALGRAIDADVAARLAVRQAARIVDHVHRLDRSGARGGTPASQTVPEPPYPAPVSRASRQLHPPGSIGKEANDETDY